MPSVYRATANETWCNTTPNTFNNSRLVRILNNSAQDWLITTTNNSVNVSSITVMSGTEMFIRKWNYDTLLSNSAANSVLAVPVAFETT